MSRTHKFLLSLSIACACIFGFTQQAAAMHIMEGYLPLVHAIGWGALALPFVVVGYFKMNQVLKKDRRALLLLAMVGAYAFVLSALKIPSVTGSSSHPTGTGLGAILFGATPMALISLLVLLFQALLLAHGGLTTLGANVFSMGIVGPFVTVGVYSLVKKISGNTKVAVFFAAALGNLMTYVVTSSQLALAHPDAAGGILGAFTKFAAIFALTQIPLAVVEGILTVVVVIGLESFAAPELRSLGYEGGRQ